MTKVALDRARMPSRWRSLLASATTVTGLAWSGSLTTCIQESRTVSISVAEAGGNPIDGSSRTTWQAGSFCQP